MRIRLVMRSTTLSTTDEMTERDFDITAAIILMMTRIFDKEKIEVSARETKKSRTDNVSD
jgi:hypothetical protein